MKKFVLIFLGVLITAAAAAAIYVATACPCDRIPGVSLSGTDQPEPITDWGFANDVGLCQLQVSGGILPQSLNLNCMSSQGELFVSCSRCAAKRWSNTALDNPNGRIRIGENVYPVVLNRITNSDRLDHAWEARRAKLESLGREVDSTRPGHWWSFQLVSAGN